ncbi:MAG: TolC family protein [Candidatus Omnitrophica bacterium]|nr:TolC family protein [Candidatus Omnitrophota bacterium]
MKYLFIFCLLALSFINLSLFAASQDTLTWDYCLIEARKNNSELIAAQENVRQARAGRVITISNTLPEVSSQVSGSTSRSTTGVTSDSYGYSLTARQLVFDGLKTPYDIASAARNLKAAEYDYQVVSSNIRLSLRGGFVELLRAQELVDITKDIAGRREKNLEMVRLRYEAGREHKGSLLTAEANLAQALFEVAQAQRNISLAQRRLINELGRSTFTPLKVVSDFEIKDIADPKKPDFEQLAQDTPFLRQLIARKEAAGFDLKSARADFFPKIYASGSVGNTDSSWPPQNDQWSATISLSFPLFEGGSRIGALSRARSLFNQAELNQRSGRDTVILTLEEAWKELQDGLDTVSVQEKFLAAAQERAKIAQAQYSNGLISFDDWTIIEDDLVRVKKSFLNAQANALVAEANWIQARGGTLDYVQK